MVAGAAAVFNRNRRRGPLPLVDWARDERRSGHKSRRLAVLDPSRGVIDGLALLLGLAGFAKLRRPGPSSVMLRAAGVPAASVVARAVATAELAVAGAALVLPGRLAGGIVALVFAGLTVGAAVGARRAGTQACGCFGDEGAPLGPRHIATNLSAALAAGAAAILAPTSLRAWPHTAPASRSSSSSSPGSWPASCVNGSGAPGPGPAGCRPRR